MKNSQDIETVRVCLLEPTANVLGLCTYGAHNILEPLGLEYIATYLERCGYECTVIQQRCDPRGEVLARIVALRPKVLGISAQTYNVGDALWFARAAKDQLPEMIVVLGGYHAAAVPELVLESEVDYVIVGEGEIALEKLLAVLRDGEALCGVPSLAYAENGQLRVNPRCERIRDLDLLPFPKRNADILRQCRMHGLMLPPPSQQTYVSMVTATRGCPYSCTFCSSQVIWNHEIRRRSVGNVVDELEWLAENYAVNAVFFCDLTFNADKRYAITLCEEIARRDVPIRFYAMCNLRGMDREIAEAMAAAKCSKIGYGVESFTEAVRTNMKALGGMDLEHTNAVLDEVCATGVLAKCYFIIGFPWETRETLTQLREDIAALHADEIKVTFYVPFPGTRGYELHRSYLTTEDWSKFTTLSEPVVRNDDVSGEALKQFRQSIFDRFYNSPRWMERVRWRARQFPQYAEAFSEFQTFLRSQGVLRDGKNDNADNILEIQTNERVSS